MEAEDLAVAADVELALFYGLSADYRQFEKWSLLDPRLEFFSVQTVIVGDIFHEEGCCILTFPG